MNIAVFLNLIFLSGVITFFTYLFGILPIKLPTLKKSLLQRENNSFTESDINIDVWLEKFTILCNGILIGVALLIIIPEGIETFIENSSPSYNNNIDISIICLSILVGFAAMYIIDNNQLLRNKDDSNNDSFFNDKDSSTLIEELIINHASSLQDDSNLFNQENYEEINVSTSFLHRDSYLNFLRFNPRFIWPLFCQVIRYETLLIGVLFHSLADGIALGSSFLSDDQSFRMVMILAIVVHKFPTSFSIGCILFNKYTKLVNNSATSLGAARNDQYQEKINNTVEQLVKCQLFIFAVCAPIAAIFTFTLVHFIVPDIVLFSAILLLFSGGTFLYVAVHIINGDSSEHHNTNSASNVPGRSKVILNVVGMFIPIFFTLIPE